MRIRLFDTDNWSEIRATLSRNKTRTFLTAFGIFWGTAMLALLWGGAGGLEGMLKRNFQGFATNMGVCFTHRTTMPYKGFSKGMAWQMNDADISFIRRSNPYLELSTAMSYEGGTAKYGTKSRVSQILGVEGDYFKIQLPTILSGRVINDSDVSQTSKVIVVGKNIANELFGSESPEGKFVNVNNIYFKVVGVVSQTTEVSIGGRMDDAVIIPITTMRRAYNKGDKIQSFIYTARHGSSPKDIEPSIWRAVHTNHPINPEDKQALQTMDISEHFKMADNLFIGVSILALFVGLGTLLAGIIGIGNIMWIIVKERTNEIGIRRAIGATPRDIIIQILTESMTMTAIAGTAGVCFAAGVLSIIDKITYDPALGSAHFQLQFWHAICIMITFLILGTAAGIVPALKAMRIKPIEALNDK